MPMYLVVDEGEIREAQRLLESALHHLPHVGPCSVGYKGGRKTTELFGHGEGSFYGGTKVIADGDKFWNVFGFLKSPDQVQEIVVEVNLDLRDRRPAGFAAKDEQGNVVADLSGPDAIKSVECFVRKVHQFKTEVKQRNKSATSTR